MKVDEYREIDILFVRMNDTVQLIDEYYKHPDFIALPRYMKKILSNHHGKELNVCNNFKILIEVKIENDTRIFIPKGILKPVKVSYPRPKVDCSTINTKGIKAGDTVKLIDKYYNHHAYKRGSRKARKEISKLAGKTFSITGVGIRDDELNTDTDCWYAVPVELLEHCSKRKWTDDEIAEAQRIIGEIVAEAGVICFYDNLLNSGENRIHYNGVFYTAVCSDRDEYNKTIGRMVALCKATGRKLPEWVTR